MKAVILWLHRWMGLVLGLYFVVMGITGSILVYHHPIEAWLNPHTAHATVGPQRVTFAETMVAAQSAAPHLPITRVHWGGDAEDTYEFMLGQWGPEAVLAHVDPYTGKLLGQNSVTGTFVEFCRYLHYTLLLHRPGWYTNSIAGWLVALLLLAGIVLWWPKTIRQLWQRLTIAFRSNTHRVNVDTHNAVGAYTFPLLLIITITGTFFAFGGQISGTAYSLFGGAPPAKPKADPAIKAPLLPIDQLLSTAQSHAGEGVHWYRVVPAAAGKPLFEARFSNEARSRRAERIEVTLDARTGNLLRRYDTATGSNVERTFAWIHPLHVGNWGGAVMEAIYAILGLVPLGLFITGIYLWWVNRRNRIRAKRHREARHNVA